MTLRAGPAVMEETRLASIHSIQRMDEARASQ